MTHFDLGGGGIASSIGKFIFGGHAMNGFKSTTALEPAILDDILGLDFDEKTEMMDLFTPTATSADDILDKLIRELDREQENQQLEYHDRNQTGKTDVSSSSSNFDTDTNLNILSNNKAHFDLPSSSHCYDLNKANNFDTICAGGDNYHGHNIYQNSTQLPLTKGFSNFSTAAFQPDQKNDQQDFFYENSLPQLAETVEVEFSHEHSYASNQQRGRAAKTDHHGQSFLTHNGTAASTGSISPFSSSGSVRNSFSMSSASDSFVNSNDVNHNNYRFSMAKNVKTDLSNVTQHHQSYKRYKSPVDDDDEYDDDNSSAGSPDNFYDGGSSSYLKRGNKRRNGRSQYIFPFSQNDIRRDEKYPFLILSDEERQLCEKEGVKLPGKFPLTKQEERELRRIRRKIRNKRSAQESRRKKHEYIASLEDRVRACDHDNVTLRRQVEALSKNNRTLADQLRKLQSVVNNGTTKPAVQAGTCLAVLLLSFALLVAPNYDLFDKKGNKLLSGNMFKSVKGKESLQDRQNIDQLSIKSSDRLLLPGNTRTLHPGEDYETYLNSGELSPSSSSSLSSLFDSSWNSSSTGYGDILLSSNNTTLTGDVDNVSLDDGGGGAFNWTPPNGGISNSIDDWSTYLDNEDMQLDESKAWMYFPAEDTSMEPEIKQDKLDIENGKTLKPLVARFAYTGNDSDPLKNSVVDKEDDGNVINRTTKLILNRRQIKIEDF